MNEETMIVITGIIIVLIFSLPFIILPAIAHKIFERPRAAKEKTRLQAQMASNRQEPLAVEPVERLGRSGT